MERLKKDYIVYVIGVCCVILLFGSSLIFELISYSVFDENTIVNKTYYLDKKNYNIQINYPYLRNNTINKKIKNTIEEDKKLFLKEVKKSNEYENEFNVNYSYTSLNDLYSIHIRSYYSIGNEKDVRNDYILYYDKKTNEEVKSKDVIVNNKFYEVIRNETYDYLMNNKDRFKIKDYSDISKRIAAIKDNYDLISFDKDSLQLVLDPNSFNDYAYDININVYYYKVSQYLNSNYINVSASMEVNTNLVNRNYERIRDSKDFENKKLLAITFDDGPAYAKTEKLITELDKRNARVSFFMLGELAYKQKDLVKKVYNYGHTIGSHTYNHKNLKKLNDDELSFEVNYTNEILSGIIGEDIRFIRPPYGAYNEDILKKTDMAFILWSVDTLDWKYRNATKVRDYIVEHANDGDIILLHDIHATSVEGVIMAIDILKEQGFEFVSLDEMLVFRNIKLENNKAYRFLK